MMFFRVFRRKPLEYVWRNKDYDIPVKFISVAGYHEGVKYAQVEYDNTVSYVPMNELVIKNEF